MNRRLLLQMISAVPIAVGRGAADDGLRQVRLAINLGGRPVPVFQNGFLGLIDSDRRTILVIDTTGKLVASCDVAVPDASVLVVGAVAVSAQGTIAAAVAATDSDGRYASLLVFADFSGKIARVVRTTPFGAGRLLFLPNGSLLCVGREHDTQFEDVDGHSILRFYSPDGVLRGKALNVGVLRPNKRELHPLNWLLVLGNDRVGILDPDTLRYAEFNHSGAIVRSLSSFGIDPPARVSGIALLSNGDRLASVEHAELIGTKYRYGNSFGLYKFKDAGNNQVVRRVVTEIKPPDGFKGLKVLGVHNRDVVLLSIPSDRFVFAQEPLG